jgi:hypothetical protein
MLSCLPAKLIDFAAAGVFYTVTLTESLGLLDEVAKSPLLMKSEALGLSDTVRKSSATVKSELLGLSDTVAKDVSTVKGESLGLSDTILKAPAILKSESLGLVDAYSRTWAAYRSYSELLGLSDVVSKNVSLRPLTESLGFLDLVQKEPSKALTESLGLVDIHSRTWSAYRTYSELLGLIDSVRKEASKIHSESLGLKDTFTRTWSAQKVFIESLGLKDTVSKSVTLHALTEVLGLIDRLSYCRNPTVISKIIRKLIQVENILGREVDLDEINILKKIIKLYGEM